MSRLPPVGRRALLGLLLVALVATVVAARQPAGEPAPPAPASNAPTRALPRLVDLGAGTCIPCKAMAPILHELSVEYAGRMEVRFIDVRLEPEVARPYGVSTIPTQIFYAADGRELTRHQGFMAKAAILDQWRALGVEL